LKRGIILNLTSKISLLQSLSIHILHIFQHRFATKTRVAWIMSRIIPDNGREREDICYTLFVISFMQIRITYLNETPIIKNHKTPVLSPCQLCPPFRQGFNRYVLPSFASVHARKVPFLCNTIEIQNVSILYKTNPYRHDITAILLKVALSTINYLTSYSNKRFTDTEFLNDSFFL